MARVLLLLNSTRTQVLQIGVTSLPAACWDNQYSPCSTAPSSLFSHSCALSQDPRSSSPLRRLPRHRHGADVLRVQTILQKVQFSCVCYTFEECMQSQPCISGIVLFQGLLYMRSKSSTLRRTCPSCPPVCTHRAVR